MDENNGFTVKPIKEKIQLNHNLERDKMLQEFDELVKRRQLLQAWWEMDSKRAGWGDGLYVLRVDVMSPSMVAFCGQEYAGARNYHDAPDWFRECVRAEMGKEAKKIARQAYVNEIDRLDTEIEKLKEAVLQQLNKGDK